MNPYVWETTCDICGGPGVATPRTAAAQWVRGNRVMHSDPDDCRYYLDKQREELEKQKTEKP
jgi:hypothetical protein